MLVAAPWTSFLSIGVQMIADQGPDSRPCDGNSRKWDPFCGPLGRFFGWSESADV